MKKIYLIAVLVVAAFLYSCAASGQFKKNEKVSLILQDGHKVKCYVTHISKQQIFFQALSARDAYNYGDMLLVGQVQKIRLANNSEMSVDEYRDYRKNVQKAMIESNSFQGKNVLLDPLYESLKHKEIDDMSEKEFQYFLLMKEQENLQKMRAADKAEQKEQFETLEKKLDEFKTPQQLVIKPPVDRPAVSAIPPGMIKNPEVSRPALPTPVESAAIPDLGELLEQTQLLGKFLHRVSQPGVKLSPEQERFIQSLLTSKKWIEFKENLAFFAEKSRQAAERAFALSPTDFQEKLALHLASTEKLDFNAMLSQLHQLTGDEINDKEYQQLLQVLGETGANATKQLLVNYDAWIYMNQAK
ncbi:hypothetical protein JW964_21470 [candidate division KSB1 bacterium]|nr:hypothetical protein [candidate division KSB1 bacterium]